MADNPTAGLGAASSTSGGNLAAMLNGVRYLGQIVTALQAIFPQTSGTSGTATGGAATLPANPVGFLTVTLPDGTTAKVPYYAD